MDRDLLEYVRTEASPTAVVATVIASSGSVPREPGAAMVVDQGELVKGTIGGGRLEYEVCQRSIPRSPLRSRHKFHLTRDLAMCCGGQVEVFIQPARDFHSIGASAAGLFVSWTGHVTPLEQAVQKTELLADGVTLPLQRKPRLLVFGCGHVGQPVARLAKQCGFAVVVCDDNETDALAGLTDDIETVDSFELSDIEAQLGTLSVDDRIVIMTREHSFDQRIVEQVLRRPVCFVGVIGSRAKAKRFEQRLRAKGVSTSDIARVKMPVGLEIAAQTPEEIAVSIVGELVAERRG